MKLNRTMMLCLCIVLAVAMATTGTIAYLQDSASDVNVMTMGNVKIEQIEQERDENGDLTDFTQGKPAMPAVGPIEWAEEPLAVGDHEVKVFTEDLKNVIDKIVTVKNTGRSDAYIRTIIAIEAPNGDPNELLHVNYNDVDYVRAPSWTPITLDGVDYVYACYTYKDILAPGEVSAPSLIQLFLDAKATNEDIEAFGEEWEVIVLSQAVQAAGFDDAATALNEAFGEANVRNVTEWVGAALKVTVTNAAELENALANAKAGDTIELAAADYGTIDLDGELKDVTIEVLEGAQVRFNVTADAKLTDVTIKGLNADHYDASSSYVNGGIVNVKSGAEVDNLVIDNADVAISGSRACLVGVSEPTAKIAITNSKVTGAKYVVYGSAPIAELTVTGSEFNDISSWVVLMNAGDSVGAKLTISGNEFTNCTGGIAKYLGSSQPDGAATVFTNNTLESCQGHDGSDAKWFTIPGAASTVTVSGNTLDGTAWTPATAQGLGK